MHNRYLAGLATLALAATLGLASLAAAQDKSVEMNEKKWDPTKTGNTLLADFAEVEPNGSLATAQQFLCGDVLRPATISAAGDTDYFYIDVTAGTVMTIGTDADGTTGQLVDSRIRLFNASGAVVASDDDSGPGTYSLLTYTATYTGRYYLGIAGFSNSYFGIYKAFVNCVAPQPPPANDQCAGAIPLECGAIALNGTSQFANNDYSPLASGTGGCTGFVANGKDVVYVINATSGDAIDVNYTSVADGSIYLITDCASPTTSCVAGADATLTGVAEHLVYTFTSSGTYYLILDNYGTATGGNWQLVGTYTCNPVPANRKSWGAVKMIYR